MKSENLAMKGFQISEPPNFVLNGSEGEMILTITAKKELIFGEGITPEDAAKALMDAWKAILGLEQK